MIDCVICPFLANIFFSTDYKAIFNSNSYIEDVAVTILVVTLIEPVLYMVDVFGLIKKLKIFIYKKKE